MGELGNSIRCSDWLMFSNVLFLSNVCEYVQMLQTSSNYAEHGRFECDNSNCESFAFAIFPKNLKPPLWNGERDLLVGSGPASRRWRHSPEHSSESVGMGSGLGKVWMLA